MMSSTLRQNTRWYSESPLVSATMAEAGSTVESYFHAPRRLCQQSFSNRTTRSNNSNSSSIIGTSRSSRTMINEASDDGVVQVTPSPSQKKRSHQRDKGHGVKEQQHATRASTKKQLFTSTLMKQHRYSFRSVRHRNLTLVEESFVAKQLFRKEETGSNAGKSVSLKQKSRRHHVDRRHNVEAQMHNDQPEIQSRIRKSPSSKPVQRRLPPPPPPPPTSVSQSRRNCKLSKRVQRSGVGLPDSSKTTEFTTRITTDPSQQRQEKNVDNSSTEKSCRRNKNLRHDHKSRRRQKQHKSRGKSEIQYSDSNKSASGWDSLASLLGSCKSDDNRKSEKVTDQRHRSTITPSFEHSSGKDDSVFSEKIIQNHSTNASSGKEEVRTDREIPPEIIEVLAPLGLSRQPRTSVEILHEAELMWKMEETVRARRSRHRACKSAVISYVESDDDDNDDDSDGKHDPNDSLLGPDDGSPLLTRNAIKVPSDERNAVKQRQIPENCDRTTPTATTTHPVGENYVRSHETQPKTKKKDSQRNVSIPVATSLKRVEERTSSKTVEDGTDADTATSKEKSQATDTREAKLEKLSIDSGASTMAPQQQPTAETVIKPSKVIDVEECDIASVISISRNSESDATDKCHAISTDRQETEQTESETTGSATCQKTRPGNHATSLIPRVEGNTEARKDTTSQPLRPHDVDEGEKTSALAKVKQKSGKSSSLKKKERNNKKEKKAKKKKNRVSFAPLPTTTTTFSVTIKVKTSANRPSRKGKKRRRQENESPPALSESAVQSIASQITQACLSQASQTHAVREENACRNVSVEGRIEENRDVSDDSHGSECNNDSLADADDAGASVIRHEATRTTTTSKDSDDSSCRSNNSGSRRREKRLETTVPSNSGNGNLNRTTRVKRLQDEKEGMLRSGRIVDDQLMIVGATGKSRRASDCIDDGSVADVKQAHPLRRKQQQTKDSDENHAVQKLDGGKGSVPPSTRDDDVASVETPQQTDDEARVSSTSKSLLPTSSPNKSPPASATSSTKSSSSSPPPPPPPTSPSPSQSPPKKRRRVLSCGDSLAGCSQVSFGSSGTTKNSGHDCGSLVSESASCQRKRTRRSRSRRGKTAACATSNAEKQVPGSADRTPQRRFSRRLQNLRQNRNEGIGGSASASGSASVGYDPSLSETTKQMMMMEKSRTKNMNKMDPAIVTPKGKTFDDAVAISIPEVVVSPKHLSKKIMLRNVTAKSSKSSSIDDLSSSFAADNSSYFGTTIATTTTIDDDNHKNGDINNHRHGQKNYDNGSGENDDDISIDAKSLAIPKEIRVDHHPPKKVHPNRQQLQEQRQQEQQQELVLPLPSPRPSPMPSPLPSPQPPTDETVVTNRSFISSVTGAMDDQCQNQSVLMSLSETPTTITAITSPTKRSKSIIATTATAGAAATTIIPAIDVAKTTTTSSATVVSPSSKTASSFSADNNRNVESFINQTGNVNTSRREKKESTDGTCGKCLACTRMYDCLTCDVCLERLRLSSSSSSVLSIRGRRVLIDDDNDDENIENGTFRYGNDINTMTLIQPNMEKKMCLNRVCHMIKRRSKIDSLGQSMVLMGHTSKPRTLESSSSPAKTKSSSTSAGTTEKSQQEKESSSAAVSTSRQQQQQQRRRQLQRQQHQLLPATQQRPSDEESCSATIATTTTIGTSATGGAATTMTTGGSSVKLRHPSRLTRFLWDYSSTTDVTEPTTTTMSAGGVSTTSTSTTINGGSRISKKSSNNSFENEYYPRRRYYEHRRKMKSPTKSSGSASVSSLSAEFSKTSSASTMGNATSNKKNGGRTRKGKKKKKHPVHDMELYLPSGRSSSSSSNLSSFSSNPSASASSYLISSRSEGRKRLRALMQYDEADQDWS